MAMITDGTLIPSTVTKGATDFEKSKHSKKDGAKSTLLGSEGSQE